MNVLRAAQALNIHPNTIYARMRRIRELTGLDPLNYHALTEMLLATECAGDASVGVK
jgi:DNA-binding PucR family transcriptional regulator